MCMKYTKNNSIFDGHESRPDKQRAIEWCWKECCNITILMFVAGLISICLINSNQQLKIIGGMNISKNKFGGTLLSVTIFKTVKNSHILIFEMKSLESEEGMMETYYIKT